MTAFRPKLTSDGWLSGARAIPSPNSDDRPPGERVRLIVIHAISLPPNEFGGPDIVRLFTNTLNCDDHPYYRGLRDLRVSAHFLVRRDGETLQFVSVARRAWHAGVSSWRDQERCNDYSIGIELEGADVYPFTPIQYIRLARLIRILKRSCEIDDVVGHADIAPGRKTDPGPLFDWQRLRKLLRR